MMPENGLSDSDKTILLSLARQAIETYVNNKKLLRIDLQTVSPRLQEEGASFVTLTIDGYLRGCVGALDPYQSLVEDVCEHAVAAAFEDYRFPPVQASEVKDISIEISYLTKPIRLYYAETQELLDKLRPNVDGVVVRDGIRRATFLPQVWEKIPDPEDFMNQLCMKMGAPANLWRIKKLDVLIYQVEEFHE